jgi:hypothetical protein
MYRDPAFRFLLTRQKQKERKADHQDQKWRRDPNDPIRCRHRQQICSQDFSSLRQSFPSFPLVGQHLLL